MSFLGKSTTWMAMFNVSLPEAKSSIFPTFFFKLPEGNKECWLVVSTIFYFSIQLGIIPIDVQFFQRGRSTTNQNEMFTSQLLQFHQRCRPGRLDSTASHLPAKLHRWLRWERRHEKWPAESKEGDDIKWWLTMIPMVYHRFSSLAICRTLLYIYICIIYI